MSLFGSIGNFFGNAFNTVSNIGSKAWDLGTKVYNNVQNFSNSKIGTALKTGAELFYNPQGFAIDKIKDVFFGSPSTPSQATNSIKPNLIANALDYTSQLYTDKAIRNTVADVGKVFGIPTPGGGSGGVQNTSISEQSPEQQGLDLRTRLDSAYPELNPWEKAGQSGSSASIGSATIGAATNLEMQEKQLAQQQRLQVMQMMMEYNLRMSDMSLRDSINNKTIKAQLAGIGAGSSEQLQDIYNFYYKDQIRKDENRLNEAHIKESETRSRSNTLGGAKNFLDDAGEAFQESIPSMKDIVKLGWQGMKSGFGKFNDMLNMDNAIDFYREAYRKRNKRSIGHVN